MSQDAYTLLARDPHNEGTLSEQLKLERDEAIKAKDDAVATIEQLNYDMEDVVDAKEEAIVVIQKLMKDSDAAAAKRDEAIAQRDEAVADQLQLQNKLTAAVAARDSSVAMQEDVHAMIVKSSNAANKAKNEAIAAQDKLRSERDAALAAQNNLRRDLELATKAAQSSGRRASLLPGELTLGGYGAYFPDVCGACVVCVSVPLLVCKLVNALSERAAGAYLSP